MNGNLKTPHFFPYDTWQTSQKSIDPCFLPEFVNSMRQATNLRAYTATQSLPAPAMR
jgi:hypothetical protein